MPQAMYLDASGYASGYVCYCPGRNLLISNIKVITIINIKSDKQFITISCILENLRLIAFALLCTYIVNIISFIKDFFSSVRCKYFILFDIKTWGYLNMEYLTI